MWRNIIILICQCWLIYYSDIDILICVEAVLSIVIIHYDKYYYYYCDIVLLLFQSYIYYVWRGSDGGKYLFPTVLMTIIQYEGLSQFCCPDDIIVCYDDVKWYWFLLHCVFSIVDLIFMMLFLLYSFIIVVMMIPCYSYCSVMCYWYCYCVVLKLYDIMSVKKEEILRDYCIHSVSIIDIYSIIPLLFVY